MFNRQESIPVNEAKVDIALEALKNQPGGILNVTAAILNQIGHGMEPQDFAALKLDLADAQWLERNADRLDELGDAPPKHGRFRPLP